MQQQSFKLYLKSLTMKTLATWVFWWWRSSSC